jgi:hypothetical protein
VPAEIGSTAICTMRGYTPVDPTRPPLTNGPMGQVGTGYWMVPAAVSANDNVNEPLYSVGSTPSTTTMSSWTRVCPVPIVSVAVPAPPGFEQVASVTS